MNESVPLKFIRGGWRPPLQPRLLPGPLTSLSPGGFINCVTASSSSWPVRAMMMEDDDHSPVVCGPYIRSPEKNFNDTLTFTSVVRHHRLFCAKTLEGIN